MWAKSGLFCLFLFFFSHCKNKNSTTLTINDKRVNSVLGSWPGVAGWKTFALKYFKNCQILSHCFFKKNGPFPASFSSFSSFQNSWQLVFNINFCGWMDLNHRPLELEETAIPTEPQPLPFWSHCLMLLRPWNERNLSSHSSSHVVRPDWAIF